MSVRLHLLSLVTCVLLGAAGCAGGTDTNAGGGAEPAPQAPGGGDDAGAGDGSGGDDAGDGGTDQPTAEPTVNFDSADATVPSGSTTTLTWSSTDASSCQASGGWSGERGTAGSVSVGPLNTATTFTLTCSGAGGSAVAMLSVSVLGVINLAWQPPAENVDGSPVNDLSGYRIYYGSFSRSYSDQVVVDDAATTAWDMELPSGDYYIAMTAVDGEGNESDYSNEVLRAVN